MCTRLFERLHAWVVDSHPLHPYLFAAWFVLEQTGKMPADSQWLAVPALLIALGSVMLVHVVCRRVTADAVNAGIATTIVFFPVFFFRQGQVYASAVSAEFVSFRWYIPILAAGTMCLFLLLFADKRTRTSLHRALNTMMALLVAFALFLLIRQSASAEPAQVAAVRQLRQSSVRSSSSYAASDAPDIYYIILDAYTGSQSLRRHWGYDNSDFLNALKERGFYIAAESKSHYTSTALSLAASLNMDTLGNNPRPFELVRHNALVAFLRSQHFEVFNLSPFNMDGSPQFYTYFTTVAGSLSDLRFFFNSTGIGTIIAAIQAESMPEQNLRTLSQLSWAARQSQVRPKFVYAHLMTPHGPFGFDTAGTIIPAVNRKGWKDASAYLNQLIGTNHLILPIVDSILTHDARDPIIIIQGDHGSRMFSGTEGARESHTILNVYHLPRGGERILYPSISPVNSFRAILNYYFNETLPLTDDYRD